MQPALAELRKALGLSQRKFAKLAGVSQGHISEVENHVAEPSPKLQEFLERISALADAVNRGRDQGS